MPDADQKEVTTTSSSSGVTDLTSTTSSPSTSSGKSASSKKEDIDWSNDYLYDYMPNQRDLWDSQTTYKHNVSHTLKFIVADYRMMESGNCFSSPPFGVGGWSWRLTARICIPNNATELCLSVYAAASPVTFNDNYQVEATVQFTIKAKRPGFTDLTNTNTHVYGNKELDWGYGQFLTRARFVAGYVDDSGSCEIFIKVSNVHIKQGWTREQMINDVHRRLYPETPFTTEASVSKFIEELLRIQQLTGRHEFRIAAEAQKIYQKYLNSLLSISISRIEKQQKNPSLTANSTMSLKSAISYGAKSRSTKSSTSSTSTTTSTTSSPSSGNSYPPPRSARRRTPLPPRPVPVTTVTGKGDAPEKKDTPKSQNQTNIGVNKPDDVRLFKSRSTSDVKSVIPQDPCTPPQARRDLSQKGVHHCCNGHHSTAEDESDVSNDYDSRDRDTELSDVMEVLTPRPLTTDAILFVDRSGLPQNSLVYIHFSRVLKLRGARVKAFDESYKTHIKESYEEVCMSMATVLWGCEQMLCDSGDYAPPDSAKFFNQYKNSHVIAVQQLLPFLCFTLSNDCTSPESRHLCRYDFDHYDGWDMVFPAAASFNEITDCYENLMASLKAGKPEGQRACKAMTREIAVIQKEVDDLKKICEAGENSLLDIQNAVEHAQLTYEKNVQSLEKVHRLTEEVKKMRHDLVAKMKALKASRRQTGGGNADIGMNNSVRDFAKEKSAHRTEIDKINAFTKAATLESLKLAEKRVHDELNHFRDLCAYQRRLIERRLADPGLSPSAGESLTDQNNAWRNKIYEANNVSKQVKKTYLRYVADVERGIELKDMSLLPVFIAPTIPRIPSCEKPKTSLNQH